MKTLYKTFLLVSLITSFNGLAQWSPIPDKACYAQNFFTGIYNAPNYFLTDDGAIYRYTTIGGNTEPTTVSYYLCKSTDENVTASGVANGIGGLGCCSNREIIPVNQNRVAYSQNGLLSTKIVLKDNGASNTLVTLPGYENNLTATANNVYVIWKKYESFTKAHLFLNKYNSSSSFSDSLMYKGIKDVPMLYFVNDSLGYIFGKDTANNYVIVRTDNSGASWNNVMTVSNEITDIKFEGILGYAVGVNGAMYQSVDNGVNWNQLPSFTTKKLNSVSVKNLKCYVAGDSGALFHSYDFGLNWIADTVNISSNIDWVKITDGNEIYFQSKNKIYKKGNLTSVLELTDKDNQFSIFPNPAQNQINLSLPFSSGEKFKVSVYDYLGQIVRTAEDRNTIEVADLASGLYSVVVSTSKKTTYRSTFVKME